MQKADFDKVKLDNGIRIVSEKVPGVRSVSTGIWVEAGSRNETENIEGMSHFIEHLMFKGTQKRTATDIAETLDSVGGQLNAFTTKEFTCYYTKTLDEYFELGLEVLSDMFFNSTFKEKSISKEKGVIDEEIKMYEDTPDELIHDLFVQTAWPDHSLGKPILGTIESLEGITREDIINYIEEKYLSKHIVIAVAGNIEHKDVQEKVARYFEGMKNKCIKASKTQPQQIRSNSTNLRRETGQVQICLGTSGLSQNDERLHSVSVLNNILGGGLSSRLVQSIREERGLAYSVFSYHASFSDTGLFTVYAGTSPTKYHEVIHLILKEINDIKKNGITEKELTRAKEQIKGNMFLGLESVSSRMTRLGRNELCLNRIIPPSEVIDKIFAVTLEDIKKLACELFDDKYILSTIGPLDAPLDIKSFTV
ncbi:MAG: pitrilysin family protein [Clostridia bacterium]|nr:pitrilysin family protein [Clostridia bacterium]MDD4047458.1 pitrilysin family protein [Clostridia bacterium]